MADPRLGWVFAPSHHGRERVSGRWIDYATDRHGYRAADTLTAIDPKLPTIVFSGESVMVGDGLQWQDSIAGQVVRQLGIQTANLAVNGYSTDQSYTRLRAELPRFSCPVAVVTLFMTGFLDRNLNDDRPHLDRDLRWHPAHQGWRLAALAQRVVPFRDARAIEDGIAMTRAVLGSTAALARSRGAVPILAVPAFMPETAAERTLRRRILDGAGLDYLLVPLNSRWRLTGDMHPDARGASAIANAITKRLEAYQIGNQSNSGKRGRNQCGTPVK